MIIFSLKKYTTLLTTLRINNMFDYKLEEFDKQLPFIMSKLKANEDGNNEYQPKKDRIEKLKSFIQSDRIKLLEEVKNDNELKLLKSVYDETDDLVNTVKGSIRDLIDNLISKIKE